MGIYYTPGYQGHMVILMNEISIFDSVWTLENLRNIVTSWVGRLIQLWIGIASFTHIRLGVQL